MSQVIIIVEEVVYYKIQDSTSNRTNYIIDLKEKEKAILNLQSRFSKENEFDTILLIRIAKIDSTCY